MKLIVGLGNDGSKYQGTRHNLGFLVINSLAKDWKLSFKEEPSAYYQDIFIEGGKVILAKPRLYMNNSGEVVKGIMEYFNIEVNDLLVIQDDKDQNIGDFKIVRNSGHGGQNGIKDIINHIRTKDFVRLKIGIGHDDKIDTSNYVLGKWTKEQKKIIDRLTPIFKEIIKDFLKMDYASLTNKYNGNKNTK